LNFILATGGSAKAAGDLVKNLNGRVLEYMFIIELSALNGKNVLDANAYSMIQVED
jgi:adenine phosphoribosyltransferase